VNRDKTKEFLNDLKLSVQQELEKIRDKYVLRRTKEQVAEHCERLRLPSCHSSCMEVPMTPDEEQTYFEIYNKFKDSIRDAQRRGASQREKNMKILEGMLRARQTMTNRDLVHEILEGNFETGQLPSKVVQLLKDLTTHPNEKAIIFCQFHGEMDAINKALGNRCYRLDGTLDADTRTFILNRFRNDPNPGAILISQIVVGGVGLNLQEATRVYLMSPQWNPAAEMQAIGRVHRTGQTKEVVTKRYVATVQNEELPSIDLAMVSLQEKKAEDYGVITDKCFVPATRTERELSKTFFRR
jgi:SNF2 family DNA or RNA helicase